MRTSLFACLWFSLAAAVAAQAPAQAAPAPAAPAAPAVVPSTAAPAITEPYSYIPDGRRDPFVSLVNSGTELTPTKRGTGLAAFMVNEISVRGVLKSRQRLVAMVQGPDDKTYVIHQGDKLADGVVKSVTPEGLVVVQDITDPLSTQKQREVRKLLRSLEEAKE